MSFRRTARAASAAVLLVASLALGLWQAGPAAAACPNPTFTVSPSEGKPGDGIQIGGTGWFRSCTDATNDQHEPDTGIKIMFVQGTTTTLIGTASAGSDGRIEGQVFVPAQAKNGAATVRAEGTNGQPSVPYNVVGASTSTTRVTTSTTAGSGVTTTTRRNFSTTSTSTTEPDLVTTTTFAPITTTIPGPDDVVGDDEVASAAADDDEVGRPIVLLAAGSLALAAAAAISFLIYRMRNNPLEPPRP